MDLSQAGVFTLSFPFQYGTVVCRDAVQLKIHTFFSTLVPFSRGEHHIWAVRQWRCHRYLLLHARDSVPIYMVFQAPKRIKRMWKKFTKSKKEFSSCLFELAPDTFQHHQVIWSTTYLLLRFHLIWVSSLLTAWAGSARWSYGSYKNCVKMV